MLKVAMLVLAVLAVSCSDTSAKTVTVGGEKVTVARLIDGHTALCEAAVSPTEARSLFFDRSHDALHTVARGMEDVDRAQAGDLLQGKGKVESELDARPANLPDDLRRLADVYRASLGRLAIEAPPCDK